MGEESGLRGKRVLVTGGTRGIGLAVVQQFAEAGATVVASARTEAELPEGVRFVATDARDPDDLIRLAREAERLLGGVDVLVDNVGTSKGHLEGPLSVGDGDWLAMLETNLLSAVRLDRELVPGMIERGSGVVVHVTSTVNRFPQAVGVDYAASKAALSTYSKTLASAIAGQGVRVNRVSPGLTRTPLVESGIEGFAKKLGIDYETAMAGFVETIGGIPLGRLGEPAEIAAMVVFLASDQASYITGSELIVDGGQLRVV
ncbi:oxidoreductase [Amycolatopsis sp. NBC_01480]|uniref:oxidoreductase n=1 Tax=Amycolatopsis sp. NBC_01480 TaxID=2903562 RepID=UPI002E29DDC6|nr:oxidoreductase [Amycolatopsis sp. NBC_01480]